MCACLNEWPDNSKLIKVYSLCSFSSDMLWFSWKRRKYDINPFVYTKENMVLLFNHIQHVGFKSLYHVFLIVLWKRVSEKEREWEKEIIREQKRDEKRRRGKGGEKRVRKTEREWGGKEREGERDGEGERKRERKI